MRIENNSQIWSSKRRNGLQMQKHPGIRGIVVKQITFLSLCAAICAGCLDKPHNLEGPLSWLPDNSRILFGFRNTELGGLLTIQADGSGLQHLTTFPPLQDSPASSPDGRLIAYVVRSAGSWTGQIYLMDAEGKNQRQVTQNHFSDNSPAFSPDGRKLLFTRAKTNRPYSMGGMTWDGWDIWEMNLDGSTQTQLSHGAYNGIDPPNYSPDGTHIIFATYVYELKTRIIYLLDRKADGAFSPPRAIEIAIPSSMRVIEDAEPRFSPDGRRIVFVSNRVSGPGPYDDEVWTADLDGSNPKQITRNHSQNRFPAFSPDGNFIAFLSNPRRSDKSELWKIRPDGSELSRLTHEEQGRK